MSAIVGAYLLIIAPVLQSDPPPFANQKRVQMIAQTVEQTQRLIDQTAQTLKRVAEKQDQQDLDYWSGQLAIAEARLKIMPGDELARGMLKVAQSQLAMINERIAKNTTGRTP